MDDPYGVYLELVFNTGVYPKPESQIHQEIEGVGLYPLVFEKTRLSVYHVYP